MSFLNTQLYEELSNDFFIERCKNHKEVAQPVVSGDIDPEILKEVQALVAWAHEEGLKGKSLGKVKVCGGDSNMQSVSMTSEVYNSVL